MPTKEEIDAALKKVRTEKNESYAKVCFSGNSNFFVIPLKQATALLSATEGGVEIQSYYSSPPEVKPLSQDFLSIHPFSSKELEMYRVAALLKLPISELKEHM